MEHNIEDKLTETDAKEHKKVKHARKTDLPDLAKMTLQEAIELACSQSPGRAIEAELEEKHGRLIFKIELVSDDRQIRKIKIDAITKEVIDLKTKSH